MNIYFIKAVHNVLKFMHSLIFDMACYLYVVKNDVENYLNATISKRIQEGKHDC